MARYIDADKQIERYSQKLGFYIDDEGEDRFSAKCEEIRAAITALYNAPTADVVEVVHGEWITKCVKGSWTHYRYSCSNCGSGFDSNSNYCPNCGAKMDGKKVE